MFSRKNRTTKCNLKLVSVFSFIGGYISILCFLTFGVFVNCMTGNASRSSIAMGGGDINAFFGIIMLFASFIAGGFFSTKVFDRYGHILVLFIEAVLLLVVGSEYPGMQYRVLIAAFAMGLQNALGTCITWNSGRLRTSHLTGPVTDIGIALARKDKKDAMIKMTTVVFYLTGAFAGGALTNIWGAGTFSFAAIIIAALIATNGFSNTLLRRPFKYLFTNALLLKRRIRA